MAEKQSSGLDLTGQISAVDVNIKSIFDARKNIIAKLAEAKKAGNTALAQELEDNFVTLSRELEHQEAKYTSLQEQEAKPEQERISKLGEELRQPYVSPPPRGYSPYGLMPNAPNTTDNQSDFPTRQEQEERKRDIVAQIYNAPVGKDGMAAEQLPAGVRAGVGALPTPEGELEYLKRTYPKANIVPINIAGQTEYLIKNQDGTSFTTLDKGIAGTAGMLAVEAPIALGSAAAGIGTAIATKSPVTSTLAAGGTELALGTAADAITRAALGMPQQFGEDVSRRGLQAGIGTALGLGIDVVPSAVVAARMPSNFPNEFLKSYQESVKRLGLPKTAVPAGAQFGPQGLETAQELSGQFPNAGIAANMRKAQESIRILFEGVKKGVPATANDFSAIAANQEGQRRALANSIARANNKSAAVIDDAVSKILKPRAKTNVDDLGEVLRTNIEIAEAKAKRATDNQYTMMADMANDAGFKIRAEDLLKIVSIIKKQANPKKAFDESATNGVENRLRLLVADKNKISSIEKRIAGEKDVVKSNKLLRQVESIKKRGDLNFKNLDDYIKAFNDARPDNAVGGTTKDALGAKVSSEISKLRKRIYSNFKVINPDGTVSNLGDEFEKATKLVQERIAFEGNTLGRVLKEVVGEQATTPRDIVSSVMKEPFTIDRVLQALKKLELNDPTQAGITDKLQGMMRLQYLNDLGMGSKKGVALLNYDQGMLDSLYGNKSAAAARGLDSLNEKLRVLKSANVPEMTLTDLNTLSSALSKDARDEVANGIIKRNALEKQEQALVQSSIFKAASQGNFENIDPDLLSKSILSKASIGQTKTTMAKLSQASLESRNLFKGDFMRNLLDEYPGGTSSTAPPYTPLFDAKKFLVDWEAPTGKSQFAQKVETVLGQKDAQFIYDLAKVYEGNTIADIAAKGINLRTIRSGANTTFFQLIISTLSAVRNRYLAAMLLTGSERYGLKSALARNASPEKVNDAYVKMFKGVFATRQGIMALANQSSSDPEFSAELQNALKEFEKKEGLDLGGK